MQARALAAAVITDILTRSQTVNTVLPLRLEQLDSVQDRALVQELCYGVIRWYLRLEMILTFMMQRELKLKHTDIKMLIMTGIYQFDFLHIPEHAIVSATVAACEDLDKPWAKKLVNAILRRYQRERIALQDRFREDTRFLHAHPDWLLRELQHDYPSDWMQILSANNEHPPMCLRVNQRLTSRAAYLDILHQENIQAETLSYSPVGIKLLKPVPVEYIPGFHDGLVSVQDHAAQLAAPVLAPEAGYLILDACAAPGGKLAHILESVDNSCMAVAVELVPARVQKLCQTLNRLQLQAKVVEGDARTPELWWDGMQFDRILLDAPCSGTGVIRRHPDIKILRGAEDLPALGNTQQELLVALWPLLKPGGKLLYSTCSVLNCENDQQLGDFIAAHQDARPDFIQAGWGVPTTWGRQILTGQDGMDGFYYGRLEKI